MPLQCDVKQLTYVIEQAMLTRANEDKKTLRKLIIHCSASAFGDSAQIDSWHKQRGFAEIGYNFVILNGLRQKNIVYDKALDGTIEIGRSLDRYGAHTLGHNDDSIGVCLIGDAKKIEANPTLVYTYAQVDALEAIVRAFLSALPYDAQAHRVIFGHNELTTNKICPCFSVAKWLSTLT